MTKLTIDDVDFWALAVNYQLEYKTYEHLVAHIEAKLEEAYEQGKKDAIRVIEAYQIPIGNSAAGEMAAEWTFDALREIRAEIKMLPKESIC